MVSPHYTQQLPLIFTVCHWQLQTATSDMQPDCSVTPIKVPFDHHVILYCSKKKRLLALELFLRGVYIRNYPVYAHNQEEEHCSSHHWCHESEHSNENKQSADSKYKNLKSAHFFKWNHLSAQCYILQWWVQLTVLKHNTPNTMHTTNLLEAWKYYLEGSDNITPSTTTTPTTTENKF